MLWESHLIILISFWEILSKDTASRSLLLSIIIAGLCKWAFQTGCLYRSFSVGNSLRYRTDPAHQSFLHTEVLMALQFTAFFFPCQMDDHIGVTVPSNFCKSAIDCTRFSGCCLATVCLHTEYANTCSLVKDSLRWDAENRILLCLKFLRLL